MQKPAKVRLDRATPARIAASWAYRAGRRLHRGIYDSGLLRRGRLSRPVICVGNMTVGGTGKTPFLISFVNELCSRGYRPAVLSRGYGSQPPAHQPRIVSDGADFHADVVRAGDEPFLIAQNCPGVPVVIGSNRFASGQLAEKEFDPDRFVLDDGFQHEALERQIDLVLWDLRDQPEELFLLPAGRLREPLSGLGRAKAIVLTHAEYLEGPDVALRIQKIRDALTPYATRVPFFTMRSRFGGFSPLVQFGEPSAVRPLAELPGGSLLLLSGLARPQGFEAMCRAADLDVAAHLQLPDHAVYDAKLVQEFRQQAEQTGAQSILTTAKDAVKLKPLNPEGRFNVVLLETEIEETAEWSQFLDQFAPRKITKETDPPND